MLFYVPWQIGMKLINSIHQLHIINVYSPPSILYIIARKILKKPLFYEILNFFMRKIDEFSIKYVYLQQN